MKTLIQILVGLFLMGTISAAATSDTPIRYNLDQKDVQDVEIVPQGNQFSLRIALTESAAEAFYRLTQNNIGKTVSIEFDNVFISGADIEAPIESGYIRSIPATKEGAERLRQRLLGDRATK